MCVCGFIDTSNLGGVCVRTCVKKKNGDGVEWREADRPIKST